MEVILKENIKGLGYKNDIVDVKSGYGRNYLIPQGKALIASESNKKVLAENIKQASHKAAKVKADAETLASKIGTNVIEVSTKVGDNGKIFGSITPILVAESIKKAIGIELDRKNIDVSSEKIKEVGEYQINLDLHKEVQHSCTIKVVGE